MASKTTPPVLHSKKTTYILNTLKQCRKIIICFVFILIFLLSYYAGVNYQQAISTGESNIQKLTYEAQVPKSVITFTIAPSHTFTSSSAKKHISRHDAYGIELTENQVSTLLNNLPVINMSLVSDHPKISYHNPSLRVNEWNYYPENMVLVQNRAYLVRKNQFCQISYAWCGIVRVEQECANYDIKNDKSFGSNYDQCCRAYKTNKWVSIACINTLTWGENESEDSNTTLDILKEGGITCGGDSCSKTRVVEIYLGEE